MNNTASVKPGGSCWNDTHSTDTYFDCDEKYAADLKSKYGKFKDKRNAEFLVSMGLKDQPVSMPEWGQNNNKKCFTDIEKEGHDWQVLEIGCGYGGAGAFIAPFVNTYHGVDISPHVVNKGNAAILDNGIKNMQLFTAPECNLSVLGGNRYDLIFSTAVFIHVEKNVTEHYLKETRRLLKPGGCFIHHMNVTKESTLELLDERHFLYNELECDEMFREAKLLLIEKRDGSDYHPNRHMRYHIGIINNET
jgi:SAM-dependent methyltransferase|tara:strand:- start:2655 stop:3401 length:747 start_codon:yes stop_codon:yes gene_type:complete